MDEKFVELSKGTKYLYHALVKDSHKLSLTLVHNGKEILIYLNKLLSLFYTSTTQ